MFAEIRHLKLAVWIILLLSGTLRLSAGHFVPAYIGNGYNHMYFVILDARIGEIYYQSGDEIAIYDDTVCCGIGTLTSEIKYEESIYLMITASAYSGLGEADGFSEGHPVQIRCWSRVAQREDVATLTFLDRNTGVPLVSAPVFESSSTVFVKLQVDNHAPVADAGESRTVEEGEVVTLDGRGSSDADGDVLTYRWIAPAGIVLSSSVAVQPTFTAPAVDQSTDYTFTLIVSDGNQESDASQVTIFVKDIISFSEVVREERTVEAYPNPFLGEVNIGIQGEERDIFVIRIYNSSGICINRRTLDTHSDGRVVYIWNGTTESGDKVSPGLYYCVIYTKEGMKKSVTRIIKK